MRLGVRLGIDVGKSRIGLSKCDNEGILATPVETVLRAEDGSDMRIIASYVEDFAANEVLVGYPVALSGQKTASTQDAEEFVECLTNYIDVPIRFVDERLSTVTAMGQLHAVGKKVKGTRNIIDQVAAVVLLQDALDCERISGKIPGKLYEK